MTIKLNAEIAAAIEQSRKTIVFRKDALGKLSIPPALSVAMSIPLSAVSFPPVPVRPADYMTVREAIKKAMEKQDALATAIKEKVEALENNAADYDRMVAELNKKQQIEFEDFPPELLKIEAMRIETGKQLDAWSLEMDVLNAEVLPMGKYIDECDAAFSGYMKEYGDQITDYFTILEAAFSVFYSGPYWVSICCEAIAQGGPANLMDNAVKAAAVARAYSLYVDRFQQVAAKMKSDCNLTPEQNTSYQKWVDTLLSANYKKAFTARMGRIVYSRRVRQWAVANGYFQGVTNEMFLSNPWQYADKLSGKVSDYLWPVKYLDVTGEEGMVNTIVRVDYNHAIIPALQEIAKANILSQNAFYLANVPEQAFSNLLQLEYLRQKKPDILLQVLKANKIVPDNYTVKQLRADETKIKDLQLADFWSDLRDDVTEFFEDLGKELGRVFLPDSLDKAIHDALADIKKVLPVLIPGIYISTYSAFGKPVEGFEKYRVAMHDLVYSPFERVFLPDSLYKEMKAFEQKYRQEIKILGAIIVSVLAWWSGGLQVLGQMLWQGAQWVGAKIYVEVAYAWDVAVKYAYRQYAIWSTKLTAAALVDKLTEAGKKKFEEWKNGKENKPVDLPDFTDGTGSGKGGGLAIAALLTLAVASGG